MELSSPVQRVDAIKPSDSCQIVIPISGAESFEIGGNPIKGAVHKQDDGRLFFGLPSTVSGSV